MPWLEQQRTRNLQLKPGRRKLDVDHILKVGDWLCINSCIQESFPIVDNLARPVWVDGVSCKINLQKPFFGSLTIRVRPYAFIEEVLNEKHEYAILTIGSCTPGYSMCLMKKKESFYIFECHSKDEKGMPVPEGTAIITKHTASADVEIFLTELDNSLKTAIFFKLTLLISSHEEHFQSNETLLCEESANFPIK
ncbi:hypothetical protein PoB_005933900 [Plakobranchus ocellatus]|uniref:Uncharacterized protein n=1 Tax=Plakobranchus ocellatus TaxID=259542 RepID=A0AAV4CN68_9GAST|nr:hypothetical protein PoB_005933900 [Plakobranchus ocellatus]